MFYFIFALKQIKEIFSGTAQARKLTEMNSIQIVHRLLFFFVTLRPQQLAVAIKRILEFCTAKNPLFPTCSCIKHCLVTIPLYRVLLIQLLLTVNITLQYLCNLYIMIYLWVRGWPRNKLFVTNSVCNKFLARATEGTLL